MTSIKDIITCMSADGSLNPPHTESEIVPMLSFYIAPTLKECREAVVRNVHGFSELNGCILATPSFDIESRTIEHMIAHPDKKICLDYLIPGSNYGVFIFRCGFWLYRIQLIRGEWNAKLVHSPPYPTSSDYTMTEEDLLNFDMRIRRTESYTEEASEGPVVNLGFSLLHKSSSPVVEEKNDESPDPTEAILDVLRADTSNETTARNILSSLLSSEAISSLLTPSRRKSSAETPVAPRRAPVVPNILSDSAPKRRLHFDEFSRSDSGVNRLLSGLPFLDIPNHPPRPERTVVRLGKRKREPSVEECLAAIAAYKADMTDDSTIFTSGITLSARTDVVIGALNLLDANPETKMTWLASSYNGETTTYAFRTEEGDYFKISHIKSVNGDIIRADYLEDERVPLRPPVLRRTDEDDDVLMG